MTETCTKTHEGKTHVGKVVSIVGDKLTTTCSEGKQHCHTIAKDAKVTCDGKASKAADLKAGTQVRVTTKKDDKNVATAVESGKNTEQAQITKVDSKKGTVTVKMQRDGKDVEKTFELAEHMEYVDSTGNFVTAECFTSGDMVLIVENEGTLTRMKKTDVTCEGKVVSVVGDKLTTTCSEGKQHCHTIAKDAKVTCDGKAGKAADLKAGTQVRMTMKKDDQNVATKIESGKQIPAASHKA